MNISVECVHCILKTVDNLYRSHSNCNEKDRLLFTKKILGIMGSLDYNNTAPYIYSKVMRVIKEEININDFYYEEKQFYNNKILSLEEDIYKHINEANDSLLLALKYALVGNLIDFGALPNVEDELLKSIISNAKRQDIDRKTYERLKEELKNAKEITYLVDNCGEVVLDKLFLKTIKSIHKDLKINIIVRGEAVINDVTAKEAHEVGIDKYGKIISNGTDIPGTDLNEINEDTKRAFESSDFIISKGQGNFETLYGCGKNIYYLFLCKCDLFVDRFDVVKYKGILVKDGEM